MTIIGAPKSMFHSTLKRYFVWIILVTINHSTIHFVLNFTSLKIIVQYSIGYISIQKLQGVFTYVLKSMTRCSGGKDERIMDQKAKAGNEPYETKVLPSLFTVPYIVKASVLSPTIRCTTLRSEQTAYNVMQHSNICLAMDYTQPFQYKYRPLC